MMMVICSLVLIAWFSFNTDTDFWHPKFWIARMAAILIVWWNLYNQLPMVSFLVLYCLLSGCMLFSNDMLNHFTSEKYKKNYNFLDKTYYQFINIISLSLLFIFTPKETVRLCIDSMPFVAIFGGIYSFIPIKTLVKRVNKYATAYGFGGNPSINSTLMSIIAIASLGASNKFSLIGYLFATAGTIRTKGSAGIGALIVGSCIYGLYTMPYYVIGAAFVIAATSPLWWTRSKKLFPDSATKTLFNIPHPAFAMSSRDILWSFAWNEVWKPYASRLFGIGYGAFAYVMPTLQIAKGEKYFKQSKEVLPALHNDILQFLIEAGIVGVILLIFAIIELIFIGHSNPLLMAMLGCFAVNSFANYPTKLLPDSLVFLMVIKLCCTL